MDQKVGEAITTTCEKVDRTYAAVVAVEKPTETGNTDASHEVNKGKKSKRQPKLAKSGVPEDPSKSKGESLVPKKSNLNGILDTTGVKTSIVELRRLEKV